MATTAPTWQELYSQLPAEMRPYVLELEWDRERLWSLQLPVEEVSVIALEWQLALPCWRDGESYFSVRPIDVLTVPNAQFQHFERAMDADLAFPLDVTLRSDRWFVLDGIHRLLKAVALGETVVPVRKVPADVLPQLAIAS